MKKVVITDYKEYNSDLCRNGGAYSYSTIYTLVGKDLWQISYDTSAEFDYCPCCGRFNCTYCDPADDGNYDLCNTNKVLYEIKLAEADENMEVIVDGR